MVPLVRREMAFTTSRCLSFRFQRAVLRADSLLLSGALLVSLFSLVIASLDGCLQKAR